MKLLKRTVESDGSGSVTLQMEEPEGTFPSCAT